ncbi:MAG: HAD-IIIA family hydrolase [Bacillota bacterium]
MNLRRAVFLDRDGTIVEQRAGSLTSPAQLRLLEGAGRAVAALNQAGWAVVVVSNQSVVGRGQVSEGTLSRIHAALRQCLAAEGARLDAIYCCPHHPREALGMYRRGCDCRKPRPGLLFRAARELGLDLPSSYMVGDSASDLRAGAAAGCTSVLVLTGHGRHTAIELRAQLDLVAPGVWEAARLILGRQG